MASNPADKMQEAFGRFQAQDLGGAERLCVEILRDAPRYPDAMHLLGVVRLVTGRAADAVSLISGALEGKPQDPAALEHLGLAHVAHGDYFSAERAFREAIALGGQHGLLHMRLGMALAAQGKAADALVVLRRAAAISPEIPDVHLNLGNVLAGRGEAEEALACYNKVVAAQDDHAGAWFNIGKLHGDQGRFEEAASALQRAASLQPNDPEAQNDLGIVYEQLRRFDDAAASYRRAVQIDPGHAHAWKNLALLSSAQGHVKEAILAYRKALDISPRDAPVHNDLGTALRDGGDFEGAVEAYRRAIAIDPHFVPAIYNLAETFKIKGALEDAAACYDRVLAREPRNLQALSGLVHARQHMCSWDGLEQLWDRLRAEINATSDGEVSPFSLLSLPSTPQEQLACAVAWARRHLEPVAATRPALGFDFSGRRRGERLRIGYLAWGLHDHATGYWTPELFELHDRSRCEVTAYAYGPDDGSEIRARIRGAAERFVDLAREPNVSAARRIYKDGIDVLVDLTGYTFGTRSQILALRPAPVQVNWFYAGTMGTPCADYFIADPFVVPPQLEPFFTERIARLPDCYMITDRKRPVSAVVPTRAECGIPDDAFVFCYFNQTYKILPDCFASWMRIMRAVPGSVLWFLESNPWATANLAKEAGKHGVAAQRIIVAPRKPIAQHLVRYRIADLALDSFPYTSHTTAADALWVGCPLVTRVGDTFASRVAGSALISGGVPELATDTVDACERLAVELATSPGKLREIRRRLEAARDTSRLFDTPRFVRNLERAYEDMLASFLDRGPASR